MILVWQVNQGWFTKFPKFPLYDNYMAKYYSLCVFVCTCIYTDLQITKSYYIDTSPNTQLHILIVCNLAILKVPYFDFLTSLTQ